MSHRYRVREIAQQAGLSDATVDRVLHNRPNVRESRTVLIATALNGCAAFVVYGLSADAIRIYLDEAADLAQASGDQHALCENRLKQAIADNMCGEPMTARAAAEECRELADALGDQYTSRNSQIWLGNSLLVLGDVDEASRVLAPLAEERAAPGEFFTAILANILLGLAYARQGQLGRARACVETALAATANAGVFQEDLAYAILAQVALADGDGPAARQAAETSWRRTVPERMPFIRCFNPMPLALMACGELVTAPPLG